jgi:hypothetical protein
MLWGGGEDIASIVAECEPMERPMQKLNDLSRSLTALEPDITLIAVIEMSLSSWLVGGIVPGLERQPLKKLAADESALLKLLHRWREEAEQAGRRIARVVIAFEAGRDGFWLARWLRARGIEAHVIHAASVAVSREHRRAKSDRGYGDGALAAIDVAQARKVTDFRLPAHPESFQIGRGGNQIFVNVPTVHAIMVLDAADGKKKSKWTLPGGGNFPMAIDPSNGRVLVVSRSPPKLKAYGEADGALIASVDTCGDSDDVFVDPRRPRVYVSCGAGFIDVFDVRGATYDRVAHIKTVAGARTSLLVYELEVFLLAVRATITEEAAVWVYKPRP